VAGSLKVAVDDASSVF